MARSIEDDEKPPYAKYEMPFKQCVDHLFDMQAIDSNLHERLMNSAYLRNELMHKMI